MAIILEERGRGKFKPAPDYDAIEVKDLLNKKIEEERNAFADCSEAIEFDKLIYDENKFNLLSLFSGCGGLDLGFEMAGLKVVMGEKLMEAAMKDKNIFKENTQNNVFNTIYVNDIFNEARETYNINAGKYIYMDKSDIRKVKEFPKADIVLGGFPCPGFSEAGPRLVDDKRNFLYLHFIRCLMQSKPKIFVGENVKGMMTLGKGEVFKQIVQDFAAAGYTVYHKLLNSVEYGVPQIRERVILVGVRNDIDFEYKFPEPTHGYGVIGLKEVVTLREAIGDLVENPGEYFTGSYSTIFMSRNRKKSWNQPSFTIQASGRQAPIHPSGAPMVHVGKDKYIFSDGEENNRRLSVKEIARIQTFPDWYEFSKGQNVKKSENAKLDLVYKQIGNAVPVRLAMAVAEPIAEWVKKEMKIQMKNKRTKNNTRNSNLNNTLTSQKSEKQVTELFQKGSKFIFKGIEYEVVESGKPKCQRASKGERGGEPKTDIYVKAISPAKENLELKISYKKETADFIENKITAQRAEEILGSNWKEVLKEKVSLIAKQFLEKDIIYMESKGSVSKGSITLGWRFELCDKVQGKISVNMDLNENQKQEVYAGANRLMRYRDAIVNGKVIDNSGVANYILRKSKVNDIQEAIDNMKSIEEYLQIHNDVFMKCAAVNYRTIVENNRKNIEGNGIRSLLVYIEWFVKEGKLTPKVIFDKPLQYNGKEVSANLLNALNALKIINVDDLNQDNLATNRIYKKNK